MKKIIHLFLLAGLFLAACAGSNADKGAAVLVVSDGSNQKSYTVAALKALPVTESVFNQTTYVGVPLTKLLEDAGFTPQNLASVKAVATDGYSVSYEPALFLRPDVIVAYATENGSLSADDGAFRMVLPGEEGKLNIRMLAEIQVVK